MGAENVLIVLIVLIVSYGNKDYLYKPTVNLSFLLSLLLIFNIDISKFTFNSIMFSSSSMTSDADVIIVGAGVAGASLTNVLARDGRKVLCFERSLFDHNSPISPPPFQTPSRIVGELLQPGGFQTLTSLGLQPALHKIDAQPINGYAIFLSSRAEHLSYTPPGAPIHTGRAFHNGRFLRRLRELAFQNPNVTLQEARVSALETDPSGRVTGVTYIDPSGQPRSAHAPLTIACDGSGSLLRRRAAAPVPVEVYSNFHGLLLQMSGAQLPFPAHGHVVLADPAPVLFYPVSKREVRCLVDVPSSFRGDVAAHMLHVIAPQIPPELRAPFEAAVHAGGMRMMPNRVMPAPADVVRGAVLLGDAFNMRHPLTGGGMTVALSDVQILRRLLAEIPDLAEVDVVSAKLQRFYELRKPMSTTINILANALYSLFCAKGDPALEEMREACLDYLGTGGRMTQDPIAMLGGLKPQRYLLIAHFFAVAFYGCGRALMPFPTPTRVGRCWGIFRASFNIIKPLIDAEHLWPLCWVPISAL